MTQFLDTNAIRFGIAADHYYTVYTIGVGTDMAENDAPRLPDGATLADVLRPDFWKHHHTVLKVGDLIRIRANDGAFDMMLTVIAKGQGAVTMDVWPKFPDAADLQRAADVAAVAVKARSVLVARSVHGKMVPRVEFTRATNWRVIALDGNEHSSGYRTQAEAHMVMKDYLVKLKIDLADEAVASPTETPVPSTGKTTRAPGGKFAKADAAADAA